MNMGYSITPGFLEVFRSFGTTWSW